MQPLIQLSVFVTLLLLPQLSLLADDEWTKETLAVVKKNIDEKKAVLIDVREQSEWDAGHVQGAILLPLSDMQSGLSNEEIRRRLPKDKILYTHCVKGIRSMSSGVQLRELGYDVRCLKPGYQELIKSGFPKAPTP